MTYLSSTKSKKAEMKLTRLLLVFTVLTAFCFTAQAQDNAKKQVVYEFTVMNLKTAKDAAKLDSVMLTKKLIYSSKTDFNTRRITVTVDPAIDFNALRAVVIYAGFECSNENVKKTEAVTVKKEEKAND